MSYSDEEDFPSHHTDVDSDPEDTEDYVSEDDSSDGEPDEPVSLDPTIPMWAQCRHLKARTRVEIKEKAMEDGESCLQQLKSYILPHKDMFPEFRAWLATIDALGAKGVTSELLAGFFGDTGSGKSTLSAVLLGYEFAELFPTDDARASTAVVTKAVYNHSNDPAKRLRGKVERVTHQEWKEFLDNLFRDIAFLKMQSSEDDRDYDLEDRTQQAMEKVRAVYRHMSEDDIKKSSSSKLLEDKNVRDILGKTEEIECAEVDDFTDRIRRFITAEPSRKRGGRLFCQWPLVKLVTMYVKAEILERGLALADLPGTMDSNSARSQIAAEFRKNVKVFCVVAPIHRAADNKSANKFLSEVQERNMKLDGYFNGEHLCYIMTKADDFVNVDKFLKSNKKLHDQLGSEIKKSEKCRELKKLALSDLKEISGGVVRLERELVTVESQIKKFVEDTPVPKPKSGKRKRSVWSTARSNSSKSSGSKELREARKRQSDVEMKLNNVKDLQIYYSSELKRIEEELEYVEGIKKEVCIQSRNIIATRAVFAQHKESAKDLEKSQKRLRVFCVSAGKVPEVMMIRNGGKPVPGFPSYTSTGIPAVQKWLTECTLKAREERADEYLQELAELKRNMKKWAEDNMVVIPMSIQQRELMESKCTERLEELTQGQAMDKLNHETAVTVKTATADPIAQALYTHRRGIQAKMLNTVVKWGERSKCGMQVHWSTYRATAWHSGSWTSSKNVEFDWPQDLKGVMMDDAIVPLWTKVWHTKLPALKSGYDISAKLVIQHKSAALIEELVAIVPNMAEPLQSMTDNLLHLQNTMPIGSKRVFEDIQGESREIHRMMESVIISNMQDAFDYCSSQSGKGHYARNKEYMKLHIMNHGAKLYERACETVTVNIHQEINKMPENLNRAFSQDVELAKDQFKELFDRHSTGGPYDHVRRKARTEKPKAQTYIGKNIENLETSWAQSIEPKLKMEDEQVEYERYDPADFKQKYTEDIKATMFAFFGESE